jgi:hypothetical protein
MSLSSSCKLALHESLQLWLSGLSSLRNEMKRVQTPDLLGQNQLWSFR